MNLEKIKQRPNYEVVTEYQKARLHAFSFYCIDVYTSSSFLNLQN